jgi:hypothetical protein
MELYYLSFSFINSPYFYLQITFLSLSLSLSHTHTLTLSLFLSLMQLQSSSGKTNSQPDLVVPRLSENFFFNFQNLFYDFNSPDIKNQ